MSDPTISVSLPVYNGSAFLEEALRSVLAQDFRDFELVAVDDGSSDSSAAILARYPEVTLLRQENRGVAAARNVGVARGRGAYFAFIDQDDLWFPEKLRVQFDFLTARPEVGVAVCREELLLDPGFSRPAWLRPEYSAESHPSYVPSSWLIPRAVLAAVGPFDERFRCGSDTDWLCRARDAGVVVATCPEVLLKKRVHAENESRQVELCQQEMVRLLRDSIRRKRAQ